MCYFHVLSESKRNPLFLSSAKGFSNQAQNALRKRQANQKKNSKAHILLLVIFFLMN